MCLLEKRSSSFLTPCPCRNIKGTFIPVRWDAAVKNVSRTRTSSFKVHLSSMTRNNVERQQHSGNLTSLFQVYDYTVFYQKTFFCGAHGSYQRGAKYFFLKKRLRSLKFVLSPLLLFQNNSGLHICNVFLSSLVG